MREHEEAQALAVDAQHLTGRTAEDRLPHLGSARWVHVVAGRATLWALASVCALVGAVLLASSPAAVAAECSNEAVRRQQAATDLPECRAYELVSPADKALSDAWTIYIPEISVDGNAIHLPSYNPFAGSSQAAPVVVNYLLTRGGSGWTGGSIDPPLKPVIGTANSSLGAWFNPDFTEATYFDGAGALPRANPAQGPSLYLRDTATGSFTQVNELPPGVSETSFSYFAGSSVDMRVMAYWGETQWTPEALPSGGNLFEWRNGESRLASIVNGHPVPVPNASGGYGSGYIAEIGQYGGVSADGRRIFFQDGDDGSLYVREDGVTTRDVSPSQRSPQDPNGPQPRVFVGASRDGSKVFFVSREELTDEANTGTADRGQDLYEFDLSTGTVTDLSVDGRSEDLNGAEVVGGLGSVDFSDDGSYVYFTARGLLDRSQGVPGGPNLYLAHGGEVRFIATLEPPADGSPWVESISWDNSRVTPDGKFLAFESGSQIYRYDAATGALGCATCGGKAGSASFIAKGRFEPETRRAQNLLDDGTVLFQTNAALVPSDSNGVGDVYAYSGAGPMLLTSGRDESPTEFIGASPSGHDIFVGTRTRLVSQDQDNLIDVYDLRVGGGFHAVVEVQQVPCQGEACKGQAAVAGPVAAPQSSAVNRPAQMHQRHKPRQHHHKKRKKKRARRHHAKKRHGHHGKHPRAHRPSTASGH